MAATIRTRRAATRDRQRSLCIRTTLGNLRPYGAASTSAGTLRRSASIRISTRATMPRRTWTTPRPCVIVSAPRRSWTMSTSLNSSTAPVRLRTVTRTPSPPAAGTSPRPAAPHAGHQMQNPFDSRARTLRLDHRAVLRRALPVESPPVTLPAKGTQRDRRILLGHQFWPPPRRHDAGSACACAWHSFPASHRPPPGRRRRARAAARRPARHHPPARRTAHSIGSRGHATCADGRGARQIPIAVEHRLRCSCPFGPRRGQHTSSTWVCRRFRAGGPSDRRSEHLGTLRRHGGRRY